MLLRKGKRSKPDCKWINNDQYCKFYKEYCWDIIDCPIKNNI